MKSPSVFISYSHDSKEHSQRVFDLAQALRRDGITVEIDQYHKYDLHHWPTWCEKQIQPEHSDYVVMVCTEEYRRRCYAGEKPKVGKGVAWEAKMLRNYLYDQNGNQRLMPITFSEGIELPDFIKGTTQWQLSVDDFSLKQSGYENLYRTLTGKHDLTPDPVGKLVTLDPAPILERKKDYWAEEIAPTLVRIEDKVDILIKRTQTTKPQRSPERYYHVPFSITSDKFIGRKKVFAELWEHFSQGEAVVNVVTAPTAVRGGGGVGKTTLCALLLKTLYLENKAKSVFMLSASSKEQWLEQVASLASWDALDLYPDTAMPEDSQVSYNAVCRWLHSHNDDWVIGVDGADSPDARDAVQEFMQKFPQSRFLISSRRDDWQESIKLTKLDVFEPEESLDYLCSRWWDGDVSSEQTSAFQEIATELGHLALGLNLASSYMAVYKDTPQKYLQVWKERRSDVLKFHTDKAEYPTSLAQAWDLSLSQLEEVDRRILAVLSFLAPEELPRICIEEPWDSAPTDEWAVWLHQNQPWQGNESLRRLVELSLIELNSKTLLCHRLLLEVTHHSLAETDRENAHQVTMHILTHHSPPSINDVIEHWQLWHTLTPHIRQYLNSKEAKECEEPAISVLLNDWAQLLQATNRLDEAEPLMRRALAIDEASYGSEHPNVAIRLNNLALLLKATNRLDDAEPLMRQALAIDEASYGKEHPNVAIRLNNLAQLLKATNRLDDAEPLMRQALAIDEASYGTEHPNVAIRLNNLAQLLQATNRLDDAEPLMRRALAIDEASYGPEHPNVAIRLNNLATLLQATNRLDDAEPLMRQALAIDEASYGSEHPNVARNLNNLAQLLKATNRLDDAEPLMRQALAIDEASYGSEHPNVARNLNNLAQLLKATNRLDDAEPLMRQAVVILLNFTSQTGHQHPHLMAVVNNYKKLLSAMGMSEGEIEQRVKKLTEEAGVQISL